MSKQFEIRWEDRVERSVTINATSKKEALEKWRSGDYDTNKIEENDCQTISENHEIEVDEI